MRVLFWSSTFLPAIGGVEVLAARLLPALKDRGFECMVVTPMNRLNQPQITEYSGIPVYRFLFRSDATVDRVMAIRKQVASLKRAFAPATPSAYSFR